MDKRMPVVGMRVNYGYGETGTVTTVHKSGHYDVTGDDGNILCLSPARIHDSAWAEGCIFPIDSPPAEPVAKRDTIPAGCPHCADNLGRADAACARIGEKEIELAAALREVARLTREFREYRKAKQ